MKKIEYNIKQQEIIEINKSDLLLQFGLFIYIITKEGSCIWIKRDTEGIYSGPTKTNIVKNEDFIEVIERVKDK